MNMRKPSFSTDKALGTTRIDETDEDGSEMAPQDSDTAPPVIHDEIIVQEPPNRSTRRALARAFGYKANAFVASTWPRNFNEAMLQGDAEQWEQAMEREITSIHKNNTWTLVPRPKNAKIVKSR